jgi:hypothetical protein
VPEIAHRRLGSGRSLATGLPDALSTAILLLTTSLAVARAAVLAMLRNPLVTSSLCTSSRDKRAVYLWPKY